MTAKRSARRVPLSLLIPSCLAVAFLVVPVIGLLVRAPWGTLAERLTSAAVLEALRLSLVTATASAAVCVIIGVPLAWVLARAPLPSLLRRTLRALVTVPMVLPPVVGGIALLLSFGRRGVVGGLLYDRWGIQLPYTTIAVIMAATFVALPFCVLSVEGALRTADSRYEDVAATLGSSPLQTFRRVTLPLVLPGIATGAVLAWARALGEFGATITFAGSFPGITRTLPVTAYALLEDDVGDAIVVSLVLLALSLAVLVGLRERWWTGVR